MGTNAQCQTTSPDGVPFPGGYCTSVCDPTHSDPMTTFNTDCPGRSMCLKPPPGSTTTMGMCLEECTAMSGDAACRAGYSCFGFAEGNGCLPTSESACDPTKPMSCPVSDAGMSTCVAVGPDPVGACFPACDVFAQACGMDSTGAKQVCYANATGEGFCLAPTGTGGDGAACSFISDCASGLGCYVGSGAGSNVCRPYCGGPMHQQCTNGKQCVGLSATVPASTLGACAG